MAQVTPGLSIASSPTQASLSHAQGSTARAIRFLNRASFGATSADTNFVLTQGERAWLNAQFNQPPTLAVPILEAFGCAPDQAGFDVDSCPGYDWPAFVELRRDTWWTHALNAPDQLRQRVAFALSEIFVISDSGGSLTPRATTVADFHDTLLEHSFGTYRELLEAVTRHGAMGSYLSMARNAKENAIPGIFPDENFAREVMQLFSVGTRMLDDSGRPLVDPQGNEIPTYDQDVVTDMARALTGWTFDDGVTVPDDDYWAFRAVDIEAGPMRAWPAFHDTGAKSVLGGVVIPAGGTAESDLEAVMDALDQHPNVPPFMSRQLIQRLVTSNPTDEYVARVVRVWKDDGQGVRGNLEAVLRSILLDREAQHGHRILPQRFGKLKEPILMLTNLWRAFGASGAVTDVPNGSSYSFGQAPHSAASVFNFFRPDFQNEALARENLVSPELEILTEAQLTRLSNRFAFVIFEGSNIGPNPSYVDPLLNLDWLRNLSAIPEVLLAIVDERLCGGLMSAATKQAIVERLDTVPFFGVGVDPGMWRVRECFSLVLLSSDFALQR